MFKFITKIKQRLLFKREQNLIDKRNWVKLHKISLSEKGQIYLLESGWQNGISNFYLNKSFCAAARAILIKKHFDDVSKSMIVWGLSPDEVTLLVTEGDPQNIRYYIDKEYRFNEQDEIKLIERAFVDSRIEELVLYYAGKIGGINNEKAEILLIQKGKFKFIRNYIKQMSNSGLYRKSEVELIKRRDKDLVKIYSKKFIWQPDAQDLLDAGWLE